MTDLAIFARRRRRLFAGHPAETAARHAMLVLACVISVYPLVWMVFQSLKSPPTSTPTFGDRRHTPCGATSPVRGPRAISAVTCSIV